MDAVTDQLTLLDKMPVGPGHGLYPSGFPVHPDSYPYNGVSMKERINQYYVKGFSMGEPVTEPELSPEEFEVLRQWAIYYLNAPVWSSPRFTEFEAVKQQALGVTNWVELFALSQAAAKLGIDFL